MARGETKKGMTRWFGRPIDFIQAGKLNVSHYFGNLEFWESCAERNGMGRLV
jgi:hypothetical protein